MKAFITGGSGRIMSAVRPGLKGIFKEVILFSREEPDQVYPWEKSVVGDLGDLTALQLGMRGIDVVLHFGAKADEGSGEEILHSNVLGTYNVFEAARSCGVRRLVYASSHHTTGLNRVSDYSSPGAAPSPDTMYGVSKVFGEALGALYSRKWGMEVVALRIGVCRERPEVSDQLYTWLSPRDCLALIRNSVEANLSRRFLVLYGFSNNSRSFWSREGWGHIKYVPQDSADGFADQFEDDEFKSDLQGGAFADPNYRGGIWA